MLTFPVSPGDTAVHVYSDMSRIWLQVRRCIPTQDDIGTPSFKVAVGLTKNQAIAIAGELLAAATRPRYNSVPVVAPATKTKVTEIPPPKIPPLGRETGASRGPRPSRRS